LSALTFAKLHGGGNDFLVLVDRDDAWPLGPAVARALCDRHEGVGADGVMRALPPRAGGDLRMELYNADGSRPEMSGNGARCLVLAALDAGMVRGGRLTLETDAGPRQVEVAASRDGREPEISVDMGAVTLGPENDLLVGGWRARRARVGNPHLVLVADTLAGVDIASLGAELDAKEQGGINVEVIAPVREVPGGAAPGRAPRPGETVARDLLDLVVWERGVGVTLACGTGSCAAAAVARVIGIVGDEVTVRNPGGELRVRLSGDDPLAPGAMLSGPTRRVASVAVDLADLRVQEWAAVPSRPSRDDREGVSA
jgi:diaminopimelate epimerase